MTYLLPPGIKGLRNLSSSSPLSPFYWYIVTKLYMRCFVQFGAVCVIKKRQKHQWKSATFSKVPDHISGEIYDLGT